MKVGVLATVSKEGGGVYQYTHAVLETFLRYTAHEYFIIKNNKFIIAETLRLNNNHHFIEIKSSPSNILLKIKSALYIKFPMSRKFLDIAKDYKIIGKYNLDLIVNPITSLSPIYIGIPYIVTIHDLQHKYYPKFFTLKERFFRNYAYKNVAQNAALLVCESNFVKQDIVKFLGIPEEKIRVIQSPPPQNLISAKTNLEQLRKIKSRYNLPDMFLFYPAQFWYHKNHIKLVRALNLLRKKYKEEITLILVGSKKNNFESTFKEVNNLSLEKQVKWLGYVPEEDMPCLYKLSTALVMPTLFESLSIPIWEAFHLGVPVVSSNVCALPDQVGNAGFLFNPNNIEDMAEKIYRIWTDESLRRELIQKGYERVKDLTLENYAKQWEQVIEEALQKMV